MSDNKKTLDDMLGALAQANTQPTTAMTFSKGNAPVLCSFITMDEHFYVDIEDDEFMMNFEDSLEAELADSLTPDALKQAKETSEGFITLGDPSCGLPLTDDLAAMCQNALKPVQGSAINEAMEMLNKSDLACEYMAFAKEQNITIEASNMIDHMDIDFDQNVIAIPTSLDVVATALNIVRGIRAVQMSDVSATLRAQDRAVLLNRAMQAELSCVPVQVAWEMKLAGDERAWDYVSKSGVADLAYAFAHRASDDFRAMRDGRAAIAAFDQWFYSGRTRKADRALIQVLLASSEEVADAKETSNSEAIETLRMIGNRSVQGRNYLIDHFMTLLEDGFYGEVRDRSNANFMWFVKFERSFREAEARMAGVQPKDIDQSVPTNGATILSFPEMKRDRRKVKRMEAQVHTLRV